MSNGMELFRRYVEKRNEAVDAFIAETDRIKKAIEKDRVRGRSPVKLEGDTFYKFALLGETISIAGKEEAIGYLDGLRSAAYDENDQEFRTEIESQYGSVPAENAPKKRGRKPKSA
ncbi:MAG: hypothetical protein EOP06_30990 [Proteobacteria bacterium]|nr:MAG: hypothetical protein EOP06_30990 [Pseudomonadota bacterium]